ncbi:glycine hydroxymethyltransferase [Thermospira aquatica]|uniref:Serine hydroxymethyltransferase n=1 Tax=Thermospira aquatica TaxID=2828656 RepID=A0AAX3BCG7_9SPIR|nr:glycine hydroxymethyltransferase [Thermospira aquatica]URA09798.1 glycine hydroxymethyltransferase [Thermospira aquatica]
MSVKVIQEYLTSTTKPSSGMVAYMANLSQVAMVTPEIARSIVAELEAQRTHLKLIASENFSSLSVQLAMGNLLTDKYAEGFPYHRFYAGCENVDAIEETAARYACELFGAEYANVQPHSGADANLMAFWAILSTKVEVPYLEGLGETNLYKITDAQWKELKERLGNQRLLGLDYYSGGHLTHGYRYNVSARMFDVYSYAVNKETGILDYDTIEKQAMEIKPLILLAGYSAYPRKINFKRMREIADKVGAVLMVDMAHFAGLVAGGVFEGEYNPIPYAHVVTTTTHKTLRGPRGGLVLAKKEFADALDKGCPLVMGGPLPHVMAAKAVALKEALSPEFKKYARQIVQNAQALAAGCQKRGLEIVTGGTDNHLFLINVARKGITGRQAESALRECGVTLNRNSLPYDPNGPWYTSGLRIGTPAVTTLGMRENEMDEIAEIIASVVENIKPLFSEKDNGPSKAKYEIAEKIKTSSQQKVIELLKRFPLYPELEITWLKKIVEA